MKKGKKKIAILGAGPAGLSAAYNLFRKGQDVVVIDRAHYVGGASASFRIKDYIVDYGPHAFHVKKKEIVDMVTELIGDHYHKVVRNTRLIMDGKTLTYPLSLKEAFFRINPVLSLRVLIDYVFVRLKRFLPRVKKMETFEDWGVDAFGRTLYRLAFGDYSEKMWGMPGSKLSYRLAQQKLLKLSLTKIILKLLGIIDTTFEGGVTKYYDLYPKYGIGTVFEKMQEEILKNGKNKIYLDANIMNIDVDQAGVKSISFECNGEKINESCDQLISTIPLKYICEYLSKDKEGELIKKARQFKYRDIRIIYLILDKDYYSDVHWIYLLDPRYKCNRMSEQKNLNEESSPPGKTVVSMEISCNCGDKIWDMSDDELFRFVLKDLNNLKIEEKHIKDYFSLKLKDCYPIYDLGFDSNVYDALRMIEKHPNIYSTGRQGLFLNNDIHDSLEMGKLCSEFILEGRNSSQWYRFVENYIHRSLEGEKG